MSNKEAVIQFLNNEFSGFNGIGYKIEEVDSENFRVKIDLRFKKVECTFKSNEKDGLYVGLGKYNFETLNVRLNNKYFWMALLCE